MKRRDTVKLARKNRIHVERLHERAIPRTAREHVGDRAVVVRISRIAVKEFMKLRRCSHRHAKKKMCEHNRRDEANDGAGFHVRRINHWVCAGNCCGSRMNGKTYLKLEHDCYSIRASAIQKNNGPFGSCIASIAMPFYRQRSTHEIFVINKSPYILMRAKGRLRLKTMISRFASFMRRCNALKGRWQSAYSQSRRRLFFPARPSPFSVVASAGTIPFEKPPCTRSCGACEGMIVIAA